MKPKNGEKKQEFLDRFMDDGGMKKKYPKDEDRKTEANKIWDGCSPKKKKDEDDLQRFDFFGLYPDAELELTDKFEKTPEGYLKGKAIVTNIGVFPYLNPDGTIHRELRPPEEVFDGYSLESLKGIPLTNLHPNEAVTIDNIKKYQVGYTGTRVFHDSYHVAVEIIVTDLQTIEDIMEGKRALSCGYTLDLENSDGNYLGTAYDVIQRNIRYNHLAIVDRGRAGDAARMRIDSNNSLLKGYKNRKEDNMPNLKKVKIDGVEYEAEAEVIKNYTTEKDRADSLQKQLDAKSEEYVKLEAEKDTLQDKADKLGKEVEEAKNDTSKLDEAVKNRLAILKAAEDAEIEVKEDHSELDIQKSIITKVFPSAKLDGKDEVYIKARFDGAVEFLAEKKDAKNRKNVLGNTNTSVNNSDNKDDSSSNSDEAREKMKLRIAEDSRKFDERS